MLANGQGIVEVIEDRGIDIPNNENKNKMSSHLQVFFLANTE